jgi:hypothetical protein
MSASDAAAEAHPRTEYITLNPNAEPLRLESFCVNCRNNVRRAGGCRAAGA